MYSVLVTVSEFEKFSKKIKNILQFNSLLLHTVTVSEFEKFSKKNQKYLTIQFATASHSDTAILKNVLVN